MNNKDTLPKLLLRQHEMSPDRVAMRKKNYGIWEEYTWRDSYENVHYLSLCLLSMGLKRGDKVAIIGENEPQWFWAEFAAQAIGCIMVGIYTDMVPSQVQFMFTHSDACLVVANDQEQVDKFLDIKDNLKYLKKIIYWDERGLRHYDDPLLLSYKEAIELGKAYEKDHPGAFEENVQSGTGDDIAALYYTSGTSGTPKAGMVSHRALISSGKAFLDYNILTNKDNLFSYLPAAWIGEGMFGTSAHLAGGVTLNFAEEPETVQQDMREIGPQVISYGPRQWEDMARMVQVKIREAAFLNRFLYKYCLKIGYMRGALAEKGVQGNLLLRALILIADILVFFPLRENLGLRKCRIATTGSAAMSVDTFRFWSALGVRLKQVYGSTEAGFVAGHRSDHIYFETLGNVSTCADVSISKEQEILVKGPQVFSGYYKDPEKSRDIFEKDWLRTGDAGFIDEKGHLVFLDRLKDLQRLSNGTKYAPQYIEGRLRFSPYIKDAMALGGEKRHFIAVIIIIDFENVGKWAEENHLTYTTFADLSQKDEVAGLISKDIRRVNQGFADEIRVKKFVVLHKEFDPDEDELTRTRKIRRSFMEERYGKLVEAIYNGESGAAVETQVKYRDGRQAMMTTYIKIWVPHAENT